MFLEGIMANHARAIALSEEDARELERLQRSSSIPAGLMRRARVILLVAREVSGVAIARQTGYTVVQVSRLRRRFLETGMAGLQDQPRSGRPPTVTARKTARIVALTLPLPRPASRTGVPAIWPRRSASPTRRCIGSGARMRCNRIGWRPSNSARTRTPRRRSTTWSGCTCARP